MGGEKCLMSKLRGNLILVIKGRRGDTRKRDQVY